MTKMPIITKNELMFCRHKFMFIFVALMFSLLLLNIISADVIDYSPLADSYIRSGSATSNYGTDTTATFGSNAYRGLINFNLSGLTFPQNSTISEATINLYYSTLSTSSTTYATPITKSWTETGVTWNTRDGSNNWDTAGLGTTDYNITYQSSLSVSSTGWKSIDVTEIVNKTINGGWTNYGWLLTQSAGVQSVVFRTKEYTGTSFDPYLRLVYSFPEPTFTLYPANNTNQTNPNINLMCNASLFNNSQTTNITDLTIIYSNISGGYYGDELGLSATYFNDTSTPKQNNTVYANYSLSVPRDGRYYWACFASAVFAEEPDTEYGFYSMSPEYQFVVDNNAPIININYPLNTTYNINISTLNYTINDFTPNKCWYSNDSGVHNYSIQNAGTNFTNIITKEGSNTLNVYCNDSFGRQNSSLVTFSKDTIKPNIVIINPINGTNSTNANLNVNYTAGDLHLGTCYWTGNGSTNIITCGQNITAQTWSQGWNIINISVNDTYGNINSSKVSFFIDNVAPVMTWTFPADDGLVSSSNTNYFNYTILDVGVGLSSCWWSNNSGITNYTIACGNNITDIEAGDGNYNITLCSNDSLNNKDCIVRQFSINANDPMVTLLYPSNNFWSNNKNINFNMTVTHTNPIGQCQLYISTNSTNWALNQTNITGVSNSGVPFDFLPINISDGINYTWNVRCNETGAGRIGWYGVNRTFNVDTIYPEISITGLASNTGYQTVYFNWSITEDNIDHCNWTITNISDGSIETSSANLNCGALNYNSSTPEYGTHNLTIYIFDKAGNSKYSNVVFTTSASEPIVVNSGSSSTTIVNKTIIINNNITWSMFSSESGGKSFILEMTTYSSRQGVIYFYNNGVTPLNITLKCEGDLCGYLTLSQTKITLPVGKNIPTVVRFNININKEISAKKYLANIIGTDQIGLSNLITISSNVGGLGLIGKVIGNWVSTDKSKLFGLPYILVNVVLYFILLFSVYFIGVRKLSGGKIWSALFPFIIISIILVFI